jgi:hypothetical protein
VASDWREYQEESAEFFRSLGLSAETDVSIEGSRTSHDIDVLVKSQHVGFEVTWLVECKYWKTKVSKVHVLALRQIVIDVGADRGILLCEVGFQSGAIEAAELTNVTATSLEEFRTRSSDQIASMRFQELYDRIGDCNRRYWDIPKAKRIDCGLRVSPGNMGYSAPDIIKLSEDILAKAFRGEYPFKSEHLASVVYGIPSLFSSPQDVLTTVDSIVRDLEKRLHDCENRSTDS